MKVEIKNEKENEQEIAYPILMKSKTCSIVVLFTDQIHGVCLKPSKIREIGEGGTWVKCTDETEWQKFTGEIIIKND